MALIFEVVREIKNVLAERGIATLGPIDTMETFAQKNSDLLNIVAQMPGEAGAVSAFWQLTYMTAMHLRSGEPVFALSPTLITLLGDTDIPKINLDLLRLPFPCIMLDTQKQPLSVKDTQVVCIYIAQPEDKLRIFAGCEDSTGLFVNLLTEGVNTISEAFDATIVRSLADGFRSLNDPILQALATWSKISHDWQDSKTKFMVEYKQMLTLAINAILYITSPNADIIRANQKEINDLTSKLKGMKQGFRRSTIEELLRKAKQRKIHIVGRSVTVAPEYVANYTEEGRKVAFRHRVRGHWKPVRFGEKKQLLRQQWIQPYWRGPTMAEVLARNYVVDTPKDIT